MSKKFMKPTEKKGTLSKKEIGLWCAGAAVFVLICCLVLTMTAVDGDRTYPVYINEILASNTRYPNGDGRCCDYIELYNSADYPVSLNGFQLGDLEGSGRYAFPHGTTMEPHSYLVVYCDSTAEGDGYASFGISRGGGETFYLIASNSAIVDSVTTVATDMDQAMILMEDGSWGVSNAVTPGYANTEAGKNTEDIYNAGVSPVRISEFSSVNTGYLAEYGLMCDWVELHNTASAAVDISGFILSDNPGNDKFRFPEGTVIPGDGYLVVYCTDKLESAEVAPFGLSKLGGETLVLKNTQGQIIEVIESRPMSAGSAMALDGDGIWSITQTASPGYENTPQGHADFLHSIGADVGTVVISELAAATQFVLPDSYGDFPDWAELYNTGDEPVNLEGWFLSDDPSEPQKWQFPQVQIQPGERMIVFLSGRDTTEGGEIHTNFSLSASGESLILSSCMVTEVDSVTFGPSETNCSFVCDGAEPVLTDCPTPGYTNDPEGYEQFCAAMVPRGPLAIWEVMTYNDWYLAQATGECYDWVEVRNVSDETIRLSDYSISDDPDSPGTYVLPDKTLAPGEYITIILSGDESLSTARYPHAGFALNAAQDQLFLFGPEEQLLDYVFLKDIPVHSSYGRSDSSGGFFYMTPTPGKANASGYRQISAEPTSEIIPGVYTSDTGYTVPLTSSGTIYYTLDGSDPSEKSLVYSGPIQIDETTVLRAASVEDGKMISDIYTATFIIQEPHSIPVVSLVTDPANLWGPRGIYKSGDIDIKEETRFANVSYLGEDGSFSMDCRINLHGATSVTAFSKKSFTVSFLDVCDGALNYDIFEDGEVTQYRSLIIRASHESTFSTHMRDTLMGHMASQCSDAMLSQKYKYVALYINGEYWGLYAFRERHSAEHYAAYMGVPADTVHTVRFCIDEQNSLYDLYQFLKDNNLKSRENYEYAKSVLDVESYADWIIFESYVCNLDVYGNIRYYYSTADNIWRMGLADVDLGMFLVTGFDEIADCFHHGRLVSAFLGNEEFQDLIATRLAELLAGPLSDENVLATLEMMVDTIEDEIPMESERWGYTPAVWNRFVQEIRDYVDGRSVYLINNFCAQVGFSREEKMKYFGDLLN